MKWIFFVLTTVLSFHAAANEVCEQSQQISNVTIRFKKGIAVVPGDKGGNDPIYLIDGKVYQAIYERSPILDSSGRTTGWRKKFSGKYFELTSREFVDSSSFAIDPEQLIITRLSDGRLHRNFQAPVCVITFNHLETFDPEFPTTLDAATTSQKSCISYGWSYPPQRFAITPVGGGARRPHILCGTPEGREQFRNRDYLKRLLGDVLELEGIENEL